MWIRRMTRREMVMVKASNVEKKREDIEQHGKGSIQMDLRCSNNNHLLHGLEFSTRCTNLPGTNISNPDD